MWGNISTKMNLQYLFLRIVIARMWNFYNSGCFCYSSKLKVPFLVILFEFSKTNLESIGKGDIDESDALELSSFCEEVVSMFWLCNLTFVRNILAKPKLICTVINKKIKNIARNTIKCFFLCISTLSKPWVNDFDTVFIS